MSGKKTFSIPKKKVADQVEMIMKEMIPLLTGKRYNYKLSRKQRRKLLDALALQERHFNLDYNNMSIEEQKKNLTEFSNGFSEIVFGERKNVLGIIEEDLLNTLKTPE